LIAGQAPGALVHQSGRPFTDPSGERLRDWLGLSESEFFDQDRVAIVPMAFCFPGYDAKGADLPPPKICARTWRSRCMDALPDIRLTILVGGYAQKWHLGTRGTVMANVLSWREHAPSVFPLLHPSWRNNALIRRHPWYVDDLLPELRKTVQQVLHER
jgi:uracil-DNA glycosylase